MDLQTCLLNLRDTLAAGLPSAGSYLNGQSIVASVALVLGLFGYRHSRTSFRQKNSFESQRRLLSEKEISASYEVLKTRVADEKAGKRVRSWADIATDPNSAEFEAISRILNNFEDLAIGVYFRVFDERILKASVLTMFFRIVEVGADFVSARQGSYELAFQHLTWLHARWRRGTLPVLSSPRREWARKERALKNQIKRKRVMPLPPAVISAG